MSQEILKRLQLKLVLASRQPRNGLWATVDDFKRQLHPNHYLIFCLKELIMFNKDQSGDEAGNIRDKIQLGEELLAIVGKLDPGFTERRGKLLQFLAKERMKLMRLNESSGAAKSSYELVDQATQEAQEAVLCLN